MSRNRMRPCSVASGFLTKMVMATGAREPEPEYFTALLPRAFALSSLIPPQVEHIEA